MRSSFCASLADLIAKPERTVHDELLPLCQNSSSDSPSPTSNGRSRVKRGILKQIEGVGAPASFRDGLVSTSDCASGVVQQGCVGSTIGHA